MDVSVIIPAYNAASFIEKAVQSALFHEEVQQIILIEDGSTDTTLAVCKQLVKDNPKVQLVQHPNGENRGAGASRNLGIKNATQTYIAFLDADDHYTNIRFQKEKEIFENNPEADGVYGATGVAYLDGVGAKTWENKGMDKNKLTTVNAVIPPDHLFSYLIGYVNKGKYEGYFHIDSLTIKRSSLLKSQVLFNDHLRLHQDTVFVWQLSYYLKLYTGTFEKPVSIRGVHAQNRFIHEKNLHKSRSKQYKVLRDWSMGIKLDKSIVRRFQLRFFKNYLRSRSSWQRPLFYLQLLLKDSHTRTSFGKKQLKIVQQLTFKY